MNQKFVRIEAGVHMSPQGGPNDFAAFRVST
jgi:hypothetical protein